MTFQPSAPHKRSRWLALLAVVMLASSLLVSSAIAAPSFTFTPDDQGANDEPGQKDLTAQSSAFDNGDFFTSWLWDDLSWSGKNTGDGCSLFDTDGDGFVDYAVCATIGGKTPALLSVSVYSCSDGRKDRCTNPVLLLTTSSGCTIVNNVTYVFGSPDTQAICNISDLADSPLVPDNLDNGTLLNTCSYPSQEPNSDPSDCVLTVANTDVVVSTQSGGSISWTATLTDTATLAPSSATGSVVFKLYSGTPCDDTAVTGNLVWTSPADNAAPFEASHDITSADVTGSGPWTYYWIATYTPSGAFNADSSSCGEATTITAGVSGNSGS